MKKYIFSLFVALILSLGISAQTNLQPIAEVKLSSRAPITLGQLKTRVSALEKEIGRKMTFEERKQTLDGLINERLIVQAAEKDGIKIMDSEVNSYFNEYVSSQLGRQITETDFAQLIKENTNMSLDEYMKAQNGMTLAEFKNFLRTQLTAQRYVMVKKQSELQSIASPTDDQIRAYYEVNKQSFVQPDTVQLFLVVAAKEGKSNTAKKTVEDIQKKLASNPKATSDITREKCRVSGGGNFCQQNITGSGAARYSDGRVAQNFQYESGRSFSGNGNRFKLSVFPRA